MKGKHREKHREIKEHIEEGLRKGVTLEEMIAMVYEAAMRVEREEYLRREKDDKGNGYYEREVSLLGKRRKVKVPRSRKGGFRSSLLPEKWKRDEDVGGDVNPETDVIR